MSNQISIKKVKETDTSYVYLKALGTILYAMKGKRIFDRFGFNLPEEKKHERTPTKLLTKYKEWEYNIEASNWMNNSTGEMLSDYKISSYLEAILSENINITHN